MSGKSLFILTTVIAGLLAAAGYTVWRTVDGGGEFMASGVIEAGDIHVGSKAGGRVLQVVVKEGQSVKAGEVLARLEPYELSASLAESRAS